MLPSPYGSGLGPRVFTFRGHIRVHFRYGPATRSLPSGDFVDGLQDFGFPPSCHPNYGAPDSCPGRSITPAEQTRLTGRTSARRGLPGTAERLAYQAGPTRYVLQLKPAPGMRCSTSGLSSPFVHLLANIGYPVLSRAADSMMHRHSAEYSAYPRGPRSGPGCVVPIHHHLLDLIRPTRRHIATSPLSGLY
jgi:hypothetical protein